MMVKLEQQNILIACKKHISLLRLSRTVTEMILCGYMPRSGLFSFSTRDILGGDYILKKCKIL